MQYWSTSGEISKMGVLLPSFV